MSVIVRPDGWYKYTTGSADILCGSCVLQDLERTRLGEYTGDEVVTLDMVERLSEDEMDGGVQCDSCLTQTDDYGADDD